VNYASRANQIIGPRLPPLRTLLVFQVLIDPTSAPTNPYPLAGARDGYGDSGFGETMTLAAQGGDGKLEEQARLTPAAAERLGALYARIVDSVQSVLYADDNTVQLAVGCLLAQGHLLVEDLPGLGKTTLAKALAHSLGLEFHRVQFTADLLPADVTGAMVLDRDKREPVFRPGPIFTNVLMADELNRASARSQSALLEAMEERQVSADGITMALPQPFMVLATQNPFDAAGTSPLPAGQRDRFLLRLSMGYPSREHEDRLLARPGLSSPVDALGPALSRSDLDALQRGVSEVYVSEAIRGYILDIVTASRAHPALAVGASPRGAIALRQASCAIALSDGRHYVVPRDVQRTVEPALGHRVVLLPGSERSGTGVGDVLADLVHQIPLPRPEPLAGARTES
jgi:MoxR-like ATPase